MPGAPAGAKIESQSLKRGKVLVESTLRSASGGKFGIRNRTHRQTRFASPVIQRPAAFAVLGMRWIEPRHDHGRVHKDHGRVSFNSSTPEISPRHVPARSRICLWTAFGAPAFLRASSVPSRRLQTRTVPASIPQDCLKASGIVVVPFWVTIVSVAFFLILVRI